jgi:PiT family inorganic phosphate transporter
MPIGAITMALVIYTRQTSMWENISWWVIILSALAISLGTAIGGSRVLRRPGIRVTVLRSVYGFVSNF